MATVAVKVRNSGSGPGGGAGMERSEDVRTAQLLVSDCGEGDRKESKMAPSPWLGS